MNLDNLTDMEKLETASNLIADVFFQYQQGEIGTQLASADSCIQTAIFMMANSTQHEAKK